MSLKRINNFIVHIISYWTKSSCEKIFPSWKISRKFEIRWYIAKKQIDIEFLFKVWFSGICMKFHRFTSKKSVFLEKFWLNILTWLWFNFLWFGKLVNLNSLKIVSGDSIPWVRLKWERNDNFANNSKITFLSILGKMTTDYLVSWQFSDVPESRRIFTNFTLCR